ncbi:MAG: Synechococcus phage, partial [Bacteroidota bacterium]
MPLSRLENFLKNAEGNILYVNPSDFDATDSFENQGNSLARPFRTIQRALIEAARFSYQSGRNNDKIDKTTILVYPGTHYIDNRPGFSIEESGGLAVYRKRTGVSTWSVDDIRPFGPSTNFDILSTDNDLYKFNSVNGGAILPRGTSIIGLDLRKTKIRPLYVPNPNDTDIENSSIFNVTGTCYFTAFTIFDADITKTVFRDYSNNRFVPNYSHHKLTTFVYADGVNKVVLANRQVELTDLQMYYYKVAKAYGDITNRGLGDYPNVLDFEPSIDEFRIVGNLQSNSLGISSIRAGNGDGTGDLSSITVTTSDLRTGDDTPHNLFENSPVIISGVEVDALSYNGSFTVSEIVGLTTFRFTTSTIPSNFQPNPTTFDTAIVSIESDTVSSASPYIFNVSLRSVYGLSGLLADGNKSTGFKSMVVAQFTGVSLQKDDDAFLIYKNGVFEDNVTLPNDSEEKPLHTNSNSIFKPSHENFHIKCSNNAFIQCVSVFAIGFSKHFVTESGGDMSITNSNSNFGATSLESVGFRNESFDRDDVGYITHIIPPKELTTSENEVTWLSLDAEKIYNSASPSKLYIYNFKNIDVVPPHQLEGYRIGAKRDDLLYLTVTRVGFANSTFSAPILMPGISSGTSSKKSYLVNRSGTTN